MHSEEDWITLLDDDLSQLSAVASDSFRISTLPKEDPVCITLSSWISSGTFPTCAEVTGLCPELRLLWHHRNNLTVDDSGIIWRRRSTNLGVGFIWVLCGVMLVSFGCCVVSFGCLLGVLWVSCGCCVTWELCGCHMGVV